MKKNILFVMNHLHCGGAEKALLSLLQSIDFTLYNVDLFLFKHEGVFLKYLPKEINLLDEPREYQYFDMPFKLALVESVKNKKFDLALRRIVASYFFRTVKNKALCEQIVWKHISGVFNLTKKKYDASIGFLEKNPIYFSLEKVNARKKIGWIHTNYSNSGMASKKDIPYFNKLDNIISVSEECVESLKTNFPQLQHKMKVIYNIVSPSVIHELSEQETDDSIIHEDNKSCTNIITVARLGHEKGIDIAIEACEILLQNGCEVMWQVIGYGTEIEINNMNEKIKNHKLGQHFKLLGIKENPYPFIKKADIYVQPSRNEGKSIALDEAKILGKPIVVTNFSTAKNQIKHQENGIITEINPESLAIGIKKLIENKELRNKLIENVLNEDMDTQQEINKLYNLINI
jgi:glycosyltransferase involved in cell wall biosynthesis